jgi:hypothetical protein
MNRRDVLQKLAIVPAMGLALPANERAADPDVPFNARNAKGERLWDVRVHPPLRQHDYQGGRRVIVRWLDGEEVRSCRVINWDAPYLEHWAQNTDGRKTGDLVETRRPFTVRWQDGKTYRSAVR